MSNESSATKWIVGCLVAGILCLFACGGVAVWMIGRGVHAARDAAQQIAEEMDRQAKAMAEASNWSLPGGWTAPPADAPEDALMPPQVGEWSQEFPTTEPNIPVVNIERESRSCVYATNGQSLDVYVCPVTSEERDEVFQQAEVAISTSGTGQTTTSSDSDTTRTFFFQNWGVEGKGWLVWNGGWLFFIHAEDPQAPLGEFMSSYFAQIDGSHAQGAPHESGDSGDPDTNSQAEPNDESTDSQNPEAASTEAPAP